MIPWPMRAMMLYGVQWLLLGAMSVPLWAQAQEAPRSHYLGCVRNDGQYVPAGTMPGNPSGMTNDLCIAHCRLQNFPYAGTQGGKCVCGTPASRPSPAGEPACNTPCSGNPAQACGGNDALSVYTTMTSALAPPQSANRPPQAPTPSQSANRPPQAPTPLQPQNVWVPARPTAAVQFQWQNNGDPDTNPVRFFFTLHQYHATSQQWTLAFQTWSTTDPGQPVQNLVVPGLAPGGYYSWRVYAFDGALWSAPSTVAFFATVPP